MDQAIADNDSGDVNEEQFMILNELFEAGRYDYNRNKALVK